MKFSSKDYDRLIEILYRNPLILYKDIAEQFINCSYNDICNLMTEIRNEHIDSEAISTFLENNSIPQDTILFINGALKSLYKDNLDQSSSLGALFNEIGNHYADEEKSNRNISDPRYSVIYKYISALMLNKELPNLSSVESGLMLSLMSEILNFSNEMFVRKPEFTGAFCENIQTKLGQILVKSVLDEDKWNGRNDDALIKAFNIPEVDEEDLAGDIDAVTKSVQRQIAMNSLNPFKITLDEMKCFQGVVDDLIAEDEKDGRKIDTIFETMGMTSTSFPTVTSVNNGQKVIVHHANLPQTTHTTGGALKRSHDDVTVERDISTRYSRHDIIDVAKLREAIGHGQVAERNEEAPVTKMARSSDDT